MFIAAAFLALRREDEPKRRTRRSPLLLLWGTLFLFALGGVLRDSAEPWSPLPQDGAASVHVYFSPSCRACQTLVELAPRMRDARWFPVAEDSRDIWLIRAMAKRIAEGLPLNEAIAAAHKDIPGLADAPDLMALPEYRFGLLKPDMLLLQLRLWKNRAHVLSAGSDRLPFVEFRGLPAFFRSEERIPALHEHGAGRPELAEVTGIDLGVAGFCGGDKQPSDCEDDNSVKNSPSAPASLIDTSGMTQ
jgi:hypothetical protein